MECTRRDARGEATQERNMFTDVLIVGAGPTGLMLANQLGRRGIRATIVDRHSGPAEQSRAMAVHARTLEIYQKLGIADQALALGRRGNGANLWSGGRRKARLPLEDMGRGQSRYPYVLMLGQDDNERIMGARLRDWGVDVQWNTEVLSLRQEADSVTTTIRQADGTTREITAAYVAGCDGARSAVREMNGIGFPGAPYEHVFFVADTEATGPMVPDELNVYLWRSGFHLYFPMRGTNRWRVIGILPDDLQHKPDLAFDDLIPALRRESGAALQFQSCAWFSTYRIHHRCTERFRDRRCLLLGDAAHVHSPMGGQGMNTGLQDAYNLAWKLALVVTKQADATLLDSYEAERMPVAHKLLATTDRAFRFMVSESWFAGLIRSRVIGNVASHVVSRHRVQRAAFRTLSQIGISYPESPLSQTLSNVPAGAPTAGERFPWLQLTFSGAAGPEDVFERFDDTRFTLLVIGQPAPAAESTGFANHLDIHSVPFDGANAAALAAASISAPSYFLLRPDGHIGLAGVHYDEGAVERWFERAGVHRDRPASNGLRKSA
jgi:2-polyprenyl-6-methoxyphenol hydroxylase-like FAD-dependent oxidoreductase